MNTTMIARYPLVFGLATALLAVVGCGGARDVEPNPFALACRDGGAAGDNSVAMLCGGSADSATEEIDIVMNGPSSGTTTLRGLNFDVTYDPSKLEYVAGTTATSPLFDPTAIVLVTLADGQQGRLVVSIQQVAGASDVLVSAGHHPVLGISLRRIAGVEFGPTQVNFDRAEATTASASVMFADALALSYE